MTIHFTEVEKELMSAKNIRFHEEEYTETEAFELLDTLHDAEIYYAMNEDSESRLLSRLYAALADKVQNSIPE